MTTPSGWEPPAARQAAAEQMTTAEQKAAQQQPQGAQRPAVHGQPVAEQPRVYASTAKRSATAGSGAYVSSAARATAQAAPGAQQERATSSSGHDRSAVPEAEVRTVDGHPRPVRSGFPVLGVGQFLAWQLAAATALAAYHYTGVVAAAVVGAVAAVLVAPTVIRLHGRWLYRWFGVWMHYRGRPRTAPSGAALDTLTFAEPSAALSSMELDGREVALIAHRGGLCAVLALGPDDSTLLVGAPVRLPSPATLLPIAGAQDIPITAQLLVAVRPAPVVGPGVVERSYRELTGGDVPAERSSWLVLQAVRSAGAWTDEDLRPALHSAVRRARRHLRRVKIDTRVLDRDALVTAIGQLTGLAGTAGHPGNPHRPPARENWTGLTLDNVPHSCHRVTRWPVRAWQPEDLLVKATAVSSVLSLAVTHNTSTVVNDEDVLVEVAFRLTAADAAALTAGERMLDQAVRAVGGCTERLDGEQTIGLAATLPLGGFLP